MLKHRKKIDIIERYCGEHAHHFEWVGYARGVGTANALITKNRIMVTITGLTLDEPTDATRVKIMLGSNNTVLFNTTMTNPEGATRCERKLSEIMLALKPDNA